MVAQAVVVCREELQRQKLLRQNSGTFMWQSMWRLIQVPVVAAVCVCAGRGAAATLPSSTARTLPGICSASSSRSHSQFALSLLPHPARPPRPHPRPPPAPHSLTPPSPPVTIPTQPIVVLTASARVCVCAQGGQSGAKEARHYFHLQVRPPARTRAILIALRLAWPSARLSFC